ncbi:S1-C subfamily serine protease [Herbihabitans rhizosphaerae]|uniref:S1-C subfamily serine protease n=1 Tax=Herbihabitans rhizosphaerae TaxID=1872711 RepID=A0A4Q7L6Q0_9PSEU|nr:trypsin-like peptidase domain-containing protein [Herbihabitans rhizosphaerae]RZS44281.1 S1-C subfamily serine protease [Herbihabitans rhizosphaerae]
MSEQSNNGNGDERAPEHRLGPRPITRTPVDPAQAAVFGRPGGVDSAFAPPPGGTGGPRIGQRSLGMAPPPAEALVSAFGRPPGQPDTVLQRPPDAAPPDDGKDDPLWAGKGDEPNPWRDPGAGAMIGPPAVGPEDSDDEKKSKPTTPGSMLSLSQVLFGRTVKPLALGVLGLVALLIGTVGGVAGWFLANQGEDLTDGSVTLSEVSPGKERQAGSIAEIAGRVTRGVVSIEVRGNQLAGVGSGVVIQAGGYIVTNDHVVAPASRDTSAKITAVFNDGTRAPARVVGRDPKTDLAVVKVEVTNPTVVQLGNSDSLKVGDTVVAIGSPLGLADTVTEGIVSALHRPVTAAGDNGEPPISYDAIQTDAAINKGNSGGALVDSTGALVGINSSIRSSEGNDGSIGLGFAIPVNAVKRIAESLIQTGKVQHADLGVNARSVSAETSEGALVVNVQADSAGAKAGIQQDDVITKIGDRTVRNAAELTVAVRQHAIGATVPVQLARQGSQLTVQVTLQSD